MTCSFALQFLILRNFKLWKTVTFVDIECLLRAAVGVARRYVLRTLVPACLTVLLELREVWVVRSCSASYR